MKKYSGISSAADVIGALRVNVNHCCVIQQNTVKDLGPFHKTDLDLLTLFHSLRMAKTP